MSAGPYGTIMDDLGGGFTEVPVSYRHISRFQPYRVQPYQAHVPPPAARKVKSSTAVERRGGGSVAGGCQYDDTRPTHVHRLYPEILALIFSYLDVPDKGRAAQVCTAWREAAWYKSVWRGVEAKIDMCRSSHPMYESLKQRGIKRIQVLSLSRYKCLREIVQNVPNLVSLNMSGCYHIKDEDLHQMFLEHHPNITELNLSLCKQLTDGGLIRVADTLRGLTRLEIQGCSYITNKGFSHIARKLKKLRYLNLRSCWHLSDVGLSHISGASKDSTDGNAQLEFLGLQDCQHITDEGLKYVSEGLRSLRSLNLSFCVNITDTGLNYVSRMNTLDELNLSACDNISDIGIGYLSEGCTKLGSLNVSFCDKIGDQALLHVSHGLYGLHTLSLGSCQISDDGMLYISKSLRNLEVLNIGQCNSVTGKGLEHLYDSCKLLRSIDLYGCTKITKEAKEKILKMPNIRRDTVNEDLWQLR